MEKDNFQDWLKGQAQQFEISPPEGAFAVLMRKRKQQRRQRKLILWFGATAAGTVAASAALWILLFNNVPYEVADYTPLNHTERVQTEKSVNRSEETGTKPVRLSLENQSTETATVSSLTSSKPVKRESQNSIQRNVKTGAHGTVNNPAKPSGDADMYSRIPQQKQLETLTVPKEELVRTVDDFSAHNPAPKNDSMITAISTDTTLVTGNDPSVQALILPARAQNYWAISLVFTPQLMNSVYNANSDATLSWMKKYLQNREQNDRAQYSYNAGVKVERRLGKHWDVAAGLLYSAVQFEEIKSVNKVISDSSNRYMSLAVADKENRVVEVEHNSFDISFASLEFPLQAGYRIQQKNMYYQLHLGLAYSYLFKTRSLVFDVKDSLNVTETNDAGNDRLNRHSIFISGGVNIGYMISEKLSIYGGPIYRQSLNSLYSKDYIIRQQPYYLGLELGVKYSL